MRDQTRTSSSQEIIVVSNSPNAKHVHVREGIECVCLHNVPMVKHAMVMNAFIFTEFFFRKLLLVSSIDKLVEIAHAQHPSDSLHFDAIAEFNSWILGNVNTGFAQA